MSQNFDFNSLPNNNPPNYSPPKSNNSVVKVLLYLIVALVLFCCLLFCCVFVILPVLLGPSIGNVFSEIIQTLEATPSPGFIRLF